MTSSIPRAPRPVWDLVLSIVFLVLAFLTAIVAAFSQLFVLAFTDDCPPASCDIDRGVTGVFATWTVIAIVLVTATALTIVRLSRRRRGWWIALIGFLVVIVGAIVGFVLYIAAVGYGS